MRGAKPIKSDIMEHAVVKNVKEGIVDFFRNNWAPNQVYKVLKLHLFYILI